MEDNDLMDFVKAYNAKPIDQQPSTALEWILFLDKAGFEVRRKYNREQ